jgi:hypothetical protein
VFVVPNFRRYWLAEDALTNAWKAGEPLAEKEASDAALAAGMNASVSAYHLADAAIQSRPSWVSPSIRDLESLRRSTEAAHCYMLRTGPQVDDLTLLGAVVDAYKHFELRSSSRAVKSIKAAVVSATGWGEMAWGEGKWGGTQQVIVELSNGDIRALSSILQNVIDMWRSAMGMPLEDFGQ